ncbi:MAG: GPW/gp25 family protein [Jatrophihabitantaceae bacterium]
MNDQAVNDVVQQWLGAGFRAPFGPVPVSPAPDGSGEFGPHRRRFAPIEGIELVRQSIATILDTEPGERIMLPTFGCGLRRYLMEPNTLTTRTAMRQDITSALEQWEPRIRLTNVAVTPDEDPSLVWIEIAYLRRADLRPDNLVYPFYLR